MDSAVECLAHERDANVLAVLKGWGWSEDDSRNEMLNVNGSGISLGHPIGATGAILIGTVLDELERRDLKRGLVTMCAAGGMAPAVIIERI